MEKEDVGKAQAMLTQFIEKEEHHLPSHQKLLAIHRQAGQNGQAQKLGEKICACVVLPAGSGGLTLEALQAYLLAQGFAKFKLPERIELMTSLPRNPLGKVQRFVLQEIISGESTS